MSNRTSSRESTRTHINGIGWERRQRRRGSGYARIQEWRLPAPKFVVEPQPRDRKVELGYN